jgi:hypothetical protein
MCRCFDKYRAQNAVLVGAVLCDSRDRFDVTRDKKASNDPSGAAVEVCSYL